MTLQAQQPSDVSLPALREQWDALSNAGAHVRGIKSDAFAQALGSAMDAFAQSLSEQYGVQLNEMHWQRHTAPDGAGRHS